MTSLQNFRRIFQLIVVTTLAPCLVNQSAVYASNWTVKPVIDVQEVFTDNLFLRQSGLKTEDFISTITPGISLRKTSPGKRAEIELDYSLQNILYANNGDRNDQFHLLRVDGTGEILKESFYLDLSLNRSTQNIGNTGNTGLDNLSIAGDKATVLSYKISPYLRQRLGSIMDMDIRYTRDQLNSGAIDDSNADNISVNLSSGSDFNRLLWDINFDNSEVNNSTASSTRVRKITGKLRYLWTRKLALVSEVGYDDNRFDSSRDVDGSSWKIGTEWKPSSRTFLGASYGHRFFGDDINLEFSHRSRRSEASVSFAKIPSTTRETLLQRQVFNLSDPFGNPITDPSVQQINDLNINLPRQSTEVLILSKLTGNYGYILRKNTFNVSVLYEEYNYQLSGDTEFQRRMDIGWVWNVLPRTSSSLSIGWSKNNLRSGRDDRYLIVQYKLTHIISPELNASIGARFVDRNSNDQFGYEENRFFANLNKRF